MKTTLFLLLMVLSFTTLAQDESLVLNEDDQKVCESTIPGEMEAYSKIIRQFQKNEIEAKNFKRTETGFQNYLNQMGIKYFSSKEIATPHSENDAEKCGIENLLPPQCAWKNGGALLSIFEKLRETVKAPIIFRNWWRPTCYNSLVEGAKASDHLLAKSMDIDFKSPKDRAIAQKLICNELWKKGENIQVGIGCNSLHVGLQSPRGKRFWVYGSMQGCPVKSLDKCWDL